MTPNFNELGALQPRNECLDRQLTEDAHIGHDDLTYRLAQGALCEHAPKAFNIRFLATQRPSSMAGQLCPSRRCP